MKRKFGVQKIFNLIPSKKYVFLVIFILGSNFCVLSQNILYNINFGKNTINYFNSTPKINGVNTNIKRINYRDLPINYEKNWGGSANFSVQKKLKSTPLYLGAYLGYEHNNLLFSDHRVKIGKLNYILVNHDINVRKLDFGTKLSIVKYNFTLSTKAGLNINNNTVTGFIYEENQYFEYTNLSYVKFKNTFGYCFGMDLNYSVRIFKKLYTNLGAQYEINLSNNIVPQFYNLSYPIYSFYIGFKI
jgi:hypothetical protein